MSPPSQVQEDHMSNNNCNSMGMIEPPAYMRLLIDKTASLVAKWGPEFGKYTTMNHAGNPYFSFLNGSGPYHAYYQHRLMELQLQFLKLAAPPAVDCTGTDPKILDTAEAAQYKKWLPEGITTEELDVIKSYARLVARYGNLYVSKIPNKPPSRLLKNPTYSTSMFFKILVAAYWKCLMSPQLLPKNRKRKARASAADTMAVLEQELHHLEWERAQEKANDDGNAHNSEKEASYS